jgi:uncharacterized membrane protein
MSTSSWASVPPEAKPASTPFAMLREARPSAAGVGLRFAESQDLPSRSDVFVHGLAEAIGGPLGDHAVPPRRGGRFWTATTIVLALVLGTLVLHWAQKSPCEDGNWANLKQYRQMCYTDVLALYYAEGLNEGQVPYVDHAVEYPVLTGAFMGLLGLPVHALAGDNPTINAGEWFYLLNALILSLIAVASVAAMLRMRERRPWDIAMFAVAPALLLTATVNWDLLAVGFAVFGMYAWSRRFPVLAGVLLGLGTAAKLWPGFLFIPLLLLGLRARRFAATFTASLAGLATWVALNLPVAILHHDSWKRFFDLNSSRPIDWGTLWYIGNHTPWVGTIPGFPYLSEHIGGLNWLTYSLFGLGCLGIALLVFLAPRRPRFGQLAFLVVACFLVFSKVWSQQYVLWLLPLAVLARPRWGAFLAWQAAEICYFCAFYGELLAASGKQIFPEWVFVTAATLRLVTVCIVAGFVVRDILRPEKDVVRHTYDDDPDGGVLDGAPDAEWVTALREGSGSALARPAPGTA